MSKRFKSIFLLGLIFILSIIAYPHVGRSTATPILETTPNYWYTIALLPLDSRPPCTQFVEQLAHIAGIRVLLPEPELLDKYKKPADKKALRSWLSTVSKEADAAIISTDMLIHGSLVASRLSTGTTEDTENVLSLLKAIHQENPSVKLYVFNIIPRLIIGDSPENAVYQKDMLAYSMLKDQVDTFGNIEDTKKLAALEEKIPAKIIKRYFSLYEQNAKLNQDLTNMTEQGILSGLIIGQDDSQPFGLPNINKTRLQHALLQKPALTDKVFITRGTDEVALTLLGHIVNQAADYQPRIFVTYSTPEAPQIIMPFMPGTVAKTVQEKISIAGGIQVDDPRQADFVLYVHVGTAKNNAARKEAADKVKNLISQGYKVALVDLTENFKSSETLLPLLITDNTNIARLIAYAGWNTTSNSIGTAVTQGSIFTRSVLSPNSTPELLGIYQHNLEFLTARFLDDLYYQKEFFPIINEQLARLRIDPNNLGAEYDETNQKIDELMFCKARWLFRKSLNNQPITVETGLGSKKLVITDLHVTTNLPWQRTFEIRLKPQLSLGILNE